MRIGMMMGPERGEYREKAAMLAADARAAEAAGFTSIWVPQVPGEFDALTAVAVMGAATERIELATAVVPIQSRHPVALAQQALSDQVICAGRFALGIGPSHHWIIEDQWGLPYERPAHLVRHYLQVLQAALAGPGTVDVENELFRVHSPMDVTDITPTPILLAALAPVMLRLAGEQTAGTILWMADERAIGEYVAPRITKAAADAGRPTPRIVAAVPVALCPNRDVDAVRAYASERLGHADFSPNYMRLLEHGDATDVGDVMAAGDETAVADRIRRFRDAGVTDFAARVLPLGSDPEERRESRRRTEAFLATLTPAL